jgi:hypothetical protein
VGHLRLKLLGKSEMSRTTIAPVSTAIATMIASGTTGKQIVAALVRWFPHLTLAELSEALLAGIEQAEQQAGARR